MDYLNEALALGIDAFVMGICLKEYLNSKRHLHNLKQAPTLTINSELEKHVNSQENKKIPYAIIRGTVTPKGEPLMSLKVPDVKSVIHVQKLIEHRVAKSGFGGMWREKYKLLHTSAISIPFELVSNNYGVEVFDALNAEVLDLQLISDNYQAATYSFWDNLFQYFSGVRPKGTQTTEEVMRCGTYLTAVGQLSIENGKLCVGKSSSGPLMLTTSPKSYLVQHLTSSRNYSLIKVAITGSVAAVLIGLIVRKLILQRRRVKEEKQIEAALEAERAKRRRAGADSNENPENLCVVCQDNRKMIICLPCGHICMCPECSKLIKTNCPICRSRIKSRSVTFI